jgi:hypothetical protein
LSLVPSPWKVRPGPNLGASPVPYEQWAQMSDVIEKEPLKDIVVFPVDDLKLVTEAKTHRTRASKETLESLAQDKSVDIPVKDRAKFFCRDYAWITSKYSYQKIPTRSTEEYPDQDYEFDDYVANGNLKHVGKSDKADDVISKVRRYTGWVNREKTSGANQFHYDYIKKYAEESDDNNMKSRSEMRVPLFQYYETKSETEIREPISWEFDSTRYLTLSNLQFKITENSK